jgi:hypothetical protein
MNKTLLAREYGSSGIYSRSNADGIADEYTASKYL